MAFHIKTLESTFKILLIIMLMFCLQEILSSVVLNSVILKFMHTPEHLSSAHDSFREECFNSAWKMV